MPQTRSPFFDDVARLMNDAAGTDLTYDAVGRIIRNARRAGVQV